MTIEIELPDFEEKIETHRGFRKYVQLLADAWFRTPKRVAATLCLVSVCVGIIVWNLQRLTVSDELIAGSLQ